MRSVILSGTFHEEHYKSVNLTGTLLEDGFDKKVSFHAFKLFVI